MRNLNFSIKPVLNYRIDKQGRQTLILQIIYQRKRGVIFTPYKLMQEEFDQKKGKVLPLGRARVARERAVEINYFIATQTSELHHILEGMKRSGESFSPKDITAAYRRLGDRRLVRTFVLSLCEDLDQCAKYSTAGTYRAMLSAFERFAGNKDTRLHELDPVYLARFEDYLKSILLQRNTITFYMRVLRAVYNKARRVGLVANGGNPFEEVSFRIDKTRKRAISPETIRRIAEAEFGIRISHAQARDLFMFSFFARGMSFVDMAYLQRNAVQNGVLQYVRRKTGQVFSVRVTPPMQKLIDRYAHCAPWVLPVMKSCIHLRKSGEPLADIEPETSKAELYKRYKDALTEYWYYLGLISRELKTEKRITFNVARHSWASTARDRGIPMSVISKGLGHTSEKTTAIYIDDMDAREVDNANDVVTLL